MIPARAARDGNTPSATRATRATKRHLGDYILTRTTTHCILKKCTHLKKTDMANNAFDKEIADMFYRLQSSEKYDRAANSGVRRLPGRIRTGTGRGRSVRAVTRKKNPCEEQPALYACPACGCDADIECKCGRDRVRDIGYGGDETFIPPASPADVLTVDSAESADIDVALNDGIYAAEPFLSAMMYDGLPTYDSAVVELDEDEYEYNADAIVPVSVCAENINVNISPVTTVRLLTTRRDYMLRNADTDADENEDEDGCCLLLGDIPSLHLVPIMPCTPADVGLNIDMDYSAILSMYGLPTSL